ncbi:MAG: formyltransferase family protein [Patiriisocius sp.]|uniref:formyltransferase family protein n=1 Tax=Patiriisocius sp. TaxID=2822396 RepID=UPI003EF0C7E0
MIAVITYDTPHRKTQDLVAKFLLNGYSEIRLVVIPWVERKNFRPIFMHRPSSRVDISIEQLSKNLKIEYVRVDINELNKHFKKEIYEHIVIGGAGILPSELAKNHKIINAHPGYLPNMKGLDAFKWAIYNKQPIGVTTHYISDKADEGLLIYRSIVDIKFEDSFHNVAYRVYELEIDMLVDAIKLIDEDIATFESLNDDTFEANMRMPHHYEIIMMEKFEELRKKAPSHRPK